ncbi:MAG: hypothetical protein ABI321_11630 [Polyangia bacterium]
MNLNRSFALVVLLTGCTPQIASTGATGEEGGISSTDSALKGCHATASSSIPANESYYLTTFGGPGESGTMSCGESTKNGSWYYIASRQRYGCGAHVRLTTATKCVVAEADDYGPDVCVETAAGRPIIDASPKVAKALFGVSAAGWSEHRSIKAEVVADSTPLGPCTLPAATSTGTDTSSTSTDTSSGGTSSDPSVTCSSYTLGTDVPVMECVQSSSDSQWYQCTSAGWVALYSSGNGPLGACTQKYPL